MLLEATNIAFVDDAFITINCDEVVIINNISWIPIHLYMVQAWKRIPNFLWVKIIGVSSIFDNIFSLMLK
jgi:hypothetical protein